MWFLGLRVLAQCLECTLLGLHGHCTHVHIYIQAHTNSYEHVNIFKVPLKGENELLLFENSRWKRQEFCNILVTSLYIWILLAAVAERITSVQAIHCMNCKAHKIPTSQSSPEGHWPAFAWFLLSPLWSPVECKLSSPNSLLNAGLNVTMPVLPGLISLFAF